jgi:hypothetical protein
VSRLWKAESRVGCLKSQIRGVCRFHLISHIFLSTSEISIRMAFLDPFIYQYVLNACLVSLYFTVDALRLMSLIYIFFLCKYMVLWQNPCWEEDSQPEWLLCYSQCQSNIFSKPSNYSFGKKRWESSNLAVLLSSISMNLSKYLSLILRKDWCQSLRWQQ